MPHTKKHKRITWIVVILVVVVFLGGGALHLFYAPPVTIEVSPETTYITEPLKPDGLPDYAKYLNDRLRPEGVTPETNGVVAALRGFGGDGINSEIRDACLRELGLTELPPDSPAPVYIEDFFETIDPELTMAIPEDFDREKWNDEIGRDRLDPFAPTPPKSETPDEDGPAWDPEQDAWQLTKERVEEARRTGEKILPVYKYCQFLYGVTAADRYYFYDLPTGVQKDYLAAQRDMFRHLHEAVDRPHWYLPMLEHPDGYLTNTFVINDYRMAAKILLASICHRIQQGDGEGAKRDIVLGYRLAHRVAGEGFAIDYLVALAMRAIVNAAAFDIVKYGEFAPDELKAIRRAIAQLPPFPDYISAIERDRFVALDSICNQDRSRRDLEELLGHFFISSSPPEDEMLPRLLRVRLQHNIAMRAVNETCDRTLSTLKTTTGLDRRNRLRSYADAYERRRDRLMERLNSQWGQVTLLLMGQARRRRLFSEMHGQMTSAVMAANIEDSRLSLRVNNDLLLTGLALAEYRARRGEYPERLEALAPDYLDAVPNDRFLPTPTPLTYRRHENGFSLYSVGRNGVDDGGRPDDHSQQDIELLVNPPKREEG